MLSCWFTFFPVPIQHLPTKLGSECSRECNDDTPYHCIFNLKIKNYDTDYEHCIQDPSSCFGDGVSRQTTVIVDQNESLGAIPAPPIHVCYGDVITVNLINELEAYDATIHWHGLHMKQGLVGIEYILFLLSNFELFFVI